MSFSDMMQSSRGPGVIGTLLALVVVLGFGLLFLFAFDEGFQGGGKSIESVIKAQASEIDNMKDEIAAGTATLEREPARIAATDGLKRVRLAMKGLEEKEGVLKSKIEALKAELLTRSEQWEAYKNEYRVFIRGKAKGQVLETLETRNGEIFKSVSIREVTAIGVQIRHDNGFKRIAFEELKDDLQDFYQFDPAQKESAVADETAARDKHEAAVAVVNGQQEELMALQHEKDDIEAKAKIQGQIAEKEAQIKNLESDINGLEHDKTMAQASADAARAAGKMHLNKTGNIDSRIRYKKNQISALQADITQMQSKL